MRKTVGISQRLKRAWLDDVLDRLVQTTDEKQLRSFVNQRLRDELPGKESRAKSAGIILRVWGKVDRKHVAMRDRAVTLLPRISGQERLWLHWGMSALAYPFFRDLAEVVGRMLALQDDISTAQVQARLKMDWGDRATSKEAAQKLITTMVDWEVLRATKTKGHFLLARKMTTANTDLQLWLLEAMLTTSASDEIEAQQLLRLPELFPFSFTAGLGDLRKHEGFNIHRQGLDMDMVAVRCSKAEPPSKPAPKQNKSTKKEFDKVIQPTFFDDPNPIVGSSDSVAVTAPAAPVELPTSIPWSERGVDLTFSRVPLTGQERSIADLTKPDERSVGYRLDVERLQAQYLTIEQRLPATTPPTLRERIVAARNLAVYGFFCYEFHSVSLFWSVSCIEMALKLKFDELNPGPIAIRRKLDNSPEEEKARVPLRDLEDKLRMKWKIVDLAYFDYSFKSLLIWASRKSLLPGDIEIPMQELVNGHNRWALKIFREQATKDGLLGASPTLEDVRKCWDGLSNAQRNHYGPNGSSILIEELPRFRNVMAHPKQFNLVTPPQSPVWAFQLLIDIVGRLWPVNFAEKLVAEPARVRLGEKS